jgi:hypothetical protein
VPDVTPATDPAAAILAGIKERGYRNGATGAQCARLSDAAAEDVPLLLAAVEALSSALNRHRFPFADTSGTSLCGGCLEPSPCPDNPEAIITRALNGESSG